MGRGLPQHTCTVYTDREQQTCAFKLFLPAKQGRLQSKQASLGLKQTIICQK